jgi:hypothetical protein
MLNIQVPTSSDLTTYYQQSQLSQDDTTNNISRSSSVHSNHSSSSSSSSAYSPASSVCSSQTDSPNKPQSAYQCYSTPNMPTQQQLTISNNLKHQYYEAYSPSRQHQHQQQRLLAMQYHQLNYPNNQNQYYNYNNYQQSIKPCTNTSSFSFEDSNYYSRNASNYDTSLNESQQQLSKNTTSFGYNSLLTKTNGVKASSLKFSIDSILGTNNNSNNTSQIESTNADVVANTDVSKTKKRKSRSTNPKSNENESNSKRIRTIFTQEQLDKLEIEFNRQQYMVGNERSYLANSLNLSESQVKIWFQNRRIKWRKTSVSGGAGAKFGTDDDLNEDQSYSNDSEYDE